ncbi:MAG: S-methyl-5'-thioadenosine phosphorylase [Nitrososphaerota archaeon]|nr:S-methyl-5'-thioadenosine phosphorylase [Nitrososphaerota archaeon]MDG6973473.1 S-methyl-5'-thioadenosine phosphorylase [Nitrososphaerota archaeon]MDG6975037.1 S-methyl-5'-thioadenosine phosphorylase [Nitrososphaerota archaeon]
MKPKAEFGVFGGSGFYRFAKKSRGVTVGTPYGKPSAGVTLSEIEGKRIAFIPRHGLHHEFPPHMVPYRANVFAFKKLGVTRVIAPNAVGSLKAEVAPGDLVFCDQFVNFTTGRKDTYYDGPETTHVSTASPYCPEMRKVAAEAAETLGLKYHRMGTVVVIQGPRFSTKSESRFFSRQGWDVINMTQYPEAALAREQEMCFLNISLVTDYDAGLEGDPTVKPVSHGEVIQVFNRNIENLRKLIVEIVRHVPENRSCECGSALEHARLSV